jgi:hypothetical protein
MEMYVSPIMAAASKITRRTAPEKQLKIDRSPVNRKKPGNLIIV